MLRGIAWNRGLLRHLERAGQRVFLHSHLVEFCGLKCFTEYWQVARVKQQPHLKQRLPRRCSPPTPPRIRSLVRTDPRWRLYTVWRWTRWHSTTEKDNDIRYHANCDHLVMRFKWRYNTGNSRI